jgi:hypothetical protein
VIEWSWNTHTTNTATCSNGLTVSAVREYPLPYPGHRHQDTSVFRRLEQNLCETGNVTLTAHVIAGRSRTVRISENEYAAVEREPWRS